MKLWQKKYDLNAAVEKFTVGNDYLLDQELVPFDCQASRAHARMLNKIGILSDSETADLLTGIDQILDLHAKGQFVIRPEDEDCHTAIENFLTQKIGVAGEKIHTGRSRNDQVLTALRLYCKTKLNEISSAVQTTISTIAAFIQKYGEIAIPGFTHTRKAMPSSVAMWAGALRDALTDDLDLLACATKLIDQNPLGTGAGYGVPLALDRQMTTTELHFARIQENPIYAQNSRGKFEGFALSVMSQIMYDLNKVASDLIVFTMPEFNYFTLPEEFLTGSSIMPHKKNPDVLELLRAKYYEVFAYEMQVRNTPVNLISGYHRDLQLTKEAIIRAFKTTLASVQITTVLFENLAVNRKNCRQAMTSELFATEKVYQLVKNGVPFREAYRQISQEYEGKNEKKC
ncbi:MAG TPA: argininosuccinate lyase [Candidatus Marinimicrobia bacterium]|nr:argininosuccinate lyase [Candidatus Neomarinimicrobiota bacterium]HRU92141.1 argininosuccinate lyase [Candidatus Neomarinimicrobiota bacterium]